jgi:VWFA-related protein
MRVAILGLVCLAAIGQSDVPPTFQAGVSLVRVDAEVMEGSRVVRGLQLGHFRVFDNGREVELKAVSQDSMPLDLFLLFDVSGSMRPALEEVAKGARAALRQLRRGDRVAVAVFTTKVRLLQDLTEDLDEAEEAVRDGVLRQRFRGGTHLRESIFRSAKYLMNQPKSERRRAVLVLTDNRGQNTGYDEDTVVRWLWEADTVACGLFLDTDDDVRLGPFSVGRRGIGIMAGGYSAGMEKVAEESGGVTMKSKDPASDFATMIGQLRQRYSLFYSMPAGEPGELHEVRVELTKDGKKLARNAAVRARKGYRLPDGTTPKGTIESVSRF